MFSLKLRDDSRWRARYKEEMQICLTPSELNESALTSAGRKHASSVWLFVPNPESNYLHVDAPIPIPSFTPGSATEGLQVKEGHVVGTFGSGASVAVGLLPVPGWQTCTKRGKTQNLVS